MPAYFINVSMGNRAPLSPGGANSIPQKLKVTQLYRHLMIKLQL